MPWEYCTPTAFSWSFVSCRLSILYFYSNIFLTWWYVCTGRLHPHTASNQMVKLFVVSMFPFHIGHYMILNMYEQTRTFK